MKAKGKNEKWIAPTLVPDHLHRTFGATCKQLGIPQSDVIRSLVEAWVKKNTVDSRKRNR
jgi:hypothetical protein